MYFLKIELREIYYLDFTSDATNSNNISNITLTNKQTLLLSWILHLLLLFILRLTIFFEEPDISL